MDKAKEKFENQWNGSNIYNYLIYDESIDMYTPIKNIEQTSRFCTTVNRSYIDFTTGCKSRDEEIKKLRDEFDRFLGAVKQHINSLESSAALAVVMNAIKYYDNEALKETS